MTDDLPELLKSLYDSRTQKNALTKTEKALGKTRKEAQNGS